MRIPEQRRIAITLLCFAAIVARTDLRGQQPVQSRDAASSPSLGKRTYSSACTSCHGLDGRGSERAPNLANSAKIRALSDSQIAKTISAGIPDAGMPAFHSLTSVQVRSIVAYLRILQGESNAQPSAGNPTRGKDLFFGKGGCSRCHAVAGEGGFLGPELTSNDALLSAKDTLDAIVKPKRIVRTGYKRAAVTTRDGSRVEGIVRNEDNFSVQLQDESGAYHLLQKSDMQNFEYLSQPLMPTDYGSLLSPAELDDLVSFLIRSSAGRKATPRRSKEFDE